MFFMALAVLMRPPDRRLSGALACTAALFLFPLLLAGNASAAPAPEPAKLPPADQNGSADSPGEVDKTGKKKVPLPDFDTPFVTVYPSALGKNDLSKNLQMGVKEGHWSAGLIEMRANHFDFAGELSVLAGDTRGNPIPLAYEPYFATSVRAVALPKGEKKYLNFEFYLPPVAEAHNRRLYSTLLTRSGHEALVAPAEPLTRMRAFQFYFVVLAREPLKYRFLKNLDAITPPVDEGLDQSATAFYLVSLPKVDKQAPLPSTLLEWTDIAYVLWDDANPDVLSPEQQQALVDWIYWGGQLIISGPDSLAALQKPGGFLAALLPATSSESFSYDQAALTELDEEWSYRPAVNSPESFRLQVNKPLLGVKLSPRPPATSIRGTGDLFYERPVGRGRIVVSAIRLSERDMAINWRSFGGFFNDALLRRPPRTHRPDDGWEEEWEHSEEYKRINYQPDAATKLRLLTRERPSPAASDHSAAEPSSVIIFAGKEANVPLDPPAIEPPSPAMWTDSSEVALAARDALRVAAGVTIPPAAFVFWCVAAYLLVLVPLNWLLFRALGRVEWAWIAAPILALIGSALVTKLVHLDMGLTSSESELEIVELYNGHPRAVVTRYTAFYTSLSAPYHLTFDDPGAEALPFAAGDGVLPGLTDELQNIVLRRGAQTTMDGLEIASNSTRLVHSEVMSELGAIRLVGALGVDSQIENRTKLQLHSVGVLRRDVDNSFEFGWLGDLSPGEKKPLRLNELTDSDYARFFPPGSSSVETAREQQWSQGIVLAPLVKLLQQTDQFGSGEMRLFAWSSDELGGAHYEPLATRSQHVALVVVHLDFAPLTPAKRESTPLFRRRRPPED
jgi:hypothetical protein